MTTGPSTFQTPYLVGLEPNVRFTSILSAGDQVGVKPDGVTPWLFAGVPDGLGAFDNGDGTITVLVNHEIFSPNVTVVREHGAAGAFVSQLIIDKATLEVVDAFDAANKSYTDADGDGVWTLSPTAISRLCSADLPDVNAFFYAGADGVVGTGDDVGTQDRIFMNGEEFGADGRAFGWVITGAEARTVWELSALGTFSWENAVASAHSGAKTVVMGMDDSTPGQIYVYVGDKQTTGNTIEKAGLNNGLVYGIKAAGIGISSGSPATGTSENLLTAGTTPTSGSFTLELVPNARTSTGAQIEAASDAAGITEWWRPEDGAWDTVNANRFYFVTTSSFTTPSRLWALDFTDVTNPLAGGTFTMLLDGTEGQKMMDNITVGDDGKVYIQEDIGNQPTLGRIGVYDPATDTLTFIAQHDPARFLAPQPAPFNQDEESSGVIDVTDLLGDADTQAFLLDTQAHFAFPAPLTTELQEGGQLQVMYIDKPVDGGKGDDIVRGGYTADDLSGGKGSDVMLGGSGDDSLKGGQGNDTIVGGAGADQLNGGAGLDTFRYAKASEGGDVIRGFSVADDTIEVSAAGFGGGLVAGALDASRFVVGTAATQATGQFVYALLQGELYWDADGTGSGAAVLVADFAGNPYLSAADIVVIA